MRVWVLYGLAEQGHGMSYWDTFGGLMKGLDWRAGREVPGVYCTEVS